jgi:hypothetical protein
MLKLKLLIAAIAVTAFLVGPGAGAAMADFVCPVLPISEQAKAHATANDQFITVSGDDASILPGKAGNTTDTVSVPDNATNQDGSGSPGGDHATPGESGYTAIWNTD